MRDMEFISRKWLNGGRDWAHGPGGADARFPRGDEIETIEDVNPRFAARADLSERQKILIRAASIEVIVSACLTGGFWLSSDEEMQDNAGRRVTSKVPPIENPLSVGHAIYLADQTNEHFLALPLLPDST